MFCGDRRSAIVYPATGWTTVAQRTHTATLSRWRRGEQREEEIATVFTPSNAFDAFPLLSRFFAAQRSLAGLKLGLRPCNQISRRTNRVFCATCTAAPPPHPLPLPIYIYHYQPYHDAATRKHIGSLFNAWKFSRWPWPSTADLRSRIVKIPQ